MMKSSERSLPSALIQAIDQITAQVMAGDLPIPGMVVGIHQQGYAPFNKAYGLADIEAETPATVNTPYYIGCTTRIFTAVSILQLMEQGKLSLDDTVTKFLPGCKGTASQVTVKQLLCHRSGLPDNETMLEHLGMDVIQEYSAADRLNVVRKQFSHVEAQPGEQYQYSSFGYLALALIVEQITGMNFAEYLHAAIIEPLALPHTVHAQYPPEDIAVGYMYDSGQFVPPIQYSVSLQPYGAASLISTTSDLLLFYDALRNGRLIRPESYAQMITVASQDAMLPGFGYGLGVFICPPQGEITSMGHPGGMRGHMASLMHYPQQTLTLALTFNIIGMEYLGPLLGASEMIRATAEQGFAET